MPTYVFFGRVLPERAQINVSEIEFSMSAVEGIPENRLYVQIILNQLTARMVTEEPVTDIFTTRNGVEDAVRHILDVAGFQYGYGYDVDVIQWVDSASPDKGVFGIDVPALLGIAPKAGLEIDMMMRLLGTPNGWLVRRALSDLREALKSPADTAFFAYRAIETLMSGFAATNLLDAKKGTTWDAFRQRYGLDRDEILRIKDLSDPVRHGRWSEMKRLTGQERDQVLVSAWTMVARTLCKLDEEFDAHGKIALFA